MCGFAGFVGASNGIDFLKQAAKLLEYRGNDSFGVALLKDRTGEIEAEKSLRQLNFSKYNQSYSAGIYHSRWSTNGQASVNNAHPISSKNNIYKVVHNGIVANYKEINTKYCFKPVTETDTETIANILEEADNYEKLKELSGDFSFLALSKEMFLAYNNGNPLYVSKCYKYYGSDPAIFHGFSDGYIVLKKGEWIVIGSDYTYASNNDINSKSRLKKTPLVTNKSVHSCIMKSEILEQTEYLKKRYNQSTEGYLSSRESNIVMFGCGSSYNAALLVKKYIADYGNKCCVYYASDDFYIHPSRDEVIAISQSGETKDVLRKCKQINSNGFFPYIVTNNLDSSLVIDIYHKNEVNLNCGKEQAVAATKTYTATVLSLLNFLGIPYNTIELKNQFEKIISRWGEIKKLAEGAYTYNHVLVLGEGKNYPVAMEIALKIKEVSYIHAEAIFSSEIKHGPIALIDNDVLSIFLVNAFSANYESVKQNIDQVKARGGKVITIGNDPDICDFLFNFHKLEIYPLLYNLCGQILALELALLKGINPDKPRNLAKSVTV